MQLLIQVGKRLNGIRNSTLHRRQAWSPYAEALPTSRQANPYNEDLTASTSYRNFALVAFAVCGFLEGAQLPLRHYTSADGLVNNAVLSIASDSRGFLWFGTSEGLSRFDGFEFSNQTESTGLPHPTITRVLIGRHGNYWLATPAGLVRFRPDLPPSRADRMLVIRPGGNPDSSHILVLMEDRGGTLWCGTDAGLFASDNTESKTPRFSEIRIGLPGTAWGDSQVTALTEDAEGAVWVGTSDGILYRRTRDGHVERHTSADPIPQRQISFLLSDRKGRIWVGRGSRLDRSIPAAHPGSNGFERLSGPNHAVPAGRVFEIFESREGDVWVGIYRCLAQFPADGTAARVWNKDNGLPSRGVGALGQDRDGNLWMGTGDQGAFKLSAGGTLTYSTDDGIGVDGVISLAETLRGELFLGGRLESEGFRVATRSGGGFQAIMPLVPANVTYFGWRPARVILQDQAGEWWLASSQGLCRYPRLDSPLQLATTMPKAVYTARDGLPSNVVVRLYADHGGNIWFGTETTTLSYWSRSEGKVIRISVDGSANFATAFGEDGAGNVWIGDEDGQLWRVRNGRASPIAGPAKKAAIRGFLLDHAGRLWVATRGQGLLRFDQPATPEPRFRQYGSAEGLSSMTLYSLAEDHGGFIYLGTGGGVDRLDPDLAHIRHYTSADGIATGQVLTAFCDRTGAMWFGTNHGLTRLVPQKDPASNPPPVWITGLSIGGRRAAVSETGESHIGRADVPPGQEHIQFDFVGLSYSPGNVVRYQYRLGDRNWSAPIESRSVHYGALAPGQYRFEVRALGSDGESSPEPATVEFRVIPAFWRRGWFQGIFLALAIAGIVFVHRGRSARLVEIERVRSDIALDLHDDIASNLALITIFSEIAMREAGTNSRVGAPLARIAETARATVECVSDIVWSIRPQDEGDLSHRIRRFGSDALTSRRIEVAFHFSEEARQLTLDPNTRRQTYLIYKEAVHNIVKHAQAKAVAMSMTVEGANLVLKISDDGRGMESPEEGNGLPGMRGRAASLGGILVVRSGAGQGTEIELRAPLKRPRRSRILPR